MEKVKLNPEGFELEGEMDFQGLHIMIENDKGSVRKGVSEDGVPWETKMKFPYGYISKTKAADKEHVDCYVGDSYKSDNVFVVHQVVPETGKYDEDKVMLGFDTAEEAKQAYLDHYDDPKFFGSMTEMNFEQFKQSLKDNHGKKLKENMEFNKRLKESIKEYLKNPKVIKEEYFKPEIKRDKNNPNFINIYINYPVSNGIDVAFGKETLSGQERREGADKAINIGNQIAEKLKSKYKIEDISIEDMKNGKVLVFVVSDDFIESIPNINESKSCSCGCNSCGEGKGPKLNENFKGKLITTDAFDVHLKKSIPLHESKYPKNSKEYKNLITEATYLYARKVINLSEEDKKLILKENQEEKPYGADATKMSDKDLKSKLDMYSKASKNPKFNEHGKKLLKKYQDESDKRKQLKENKPLNEFKEGDTVKFPYVTKDNIVQGEFVRYALDWSGSGDSTKHHSVAVVKYQGKEIRIKDSLLK